MSIWGKVVGGATGFALGGPLGALIGVAAGHAIDKMSDLPHEPFDPRVRGPGGDARADSPWGDDRQQDGGRGGFSNATKQVAFTTAVIALGAKLAKADGVVTRDEIEAFKQVFRIPPGESKAVARVFNLAKKDSAGFEPYARQVARIFQDNRAVLEELLNALFHIAKADGQYHPDERAYIRTVSDIFGFDEATFGRIEAEHVVGDKADPYTVLGVSRDATDAQIKAAYRRLIRENHPDKLVAQGMPQEFIDMANEKLAKINAAYDKLSRQRGRE